jgi:hypothetical protein
MSIRRPLGELDTAGNCLGLIFLNNTLLPHYPRRAIRVIRQRMTDIFESLDALTSGLRPMSKTLALQARLFAPA